ncbi:MAG: porin [Albidovulum sp.]
MTTLSRISMAAVAALIVGMGPATAADLGGNCCADLEERVAELEATTARKGTRKVSLTISGQISQQLMFWDDGIQSDVYVSGPTQSNSRWRMLGTAKISPEITAGFLYELEAFASQSASQNQRNGSGMTVLGGSGDDAGGAISLREAMAWVEHSRLGRVSIGHGSTAANNAILVDLSGKGMAASNDVRLHSSGMVIAYAGGYSNATWGNFFQGSSGDWLNERNEHIQYRTPTIAGFTLGASWGEDNYWDVALRYAGEFNGIRIAGALGYSVRSEYNAPADNLVCSRNCSKELEQLAGSLSIRHMPTGLFFTGAAGDRDMSGMTHLGGQTGTTASLISSYDASFFYLSGGIARNFFGLGDTVIYGEYSEWKGNAQDTFTDATSSDKLTHWGVGVVQHVDAAAMEFWLAYKNYSLSGGCDICSTAEDLHLFLAGTRIRF